MRLYLAGPMTSIPSFNFPAFIAAADDLRARGHEVITPAELDDPAARAAALDSPDGNLATYEHVTGDSFGMLLSRDVRLIADANCDAVAVLKGWKHSKGSRLETFVCWWDGKPVLYYPTLRRIPRAVLIEAWTAKRPPLGVSHR